MKALAHVGPPAEPKGARGLHSSGLQVEDALGWPRETHWDASQAGQGGRHPIGLLGRLSPDSWSLPSEQGRSSSEDTLPTAYSHLTLGPPYTPRAHPRHQPLAVTSSQRSGPEGRRTCEDLAPSRHAGPLGSHHSAPAVLWEGAPEGQAQSGGLPAQPQPGLPVPNWAVEAQGSKEPPRSCLNLLCQSHMSMEMTVPTAALSMAWTHLGARGTSSSALSALTAPCCS